MNQLLTHVSRWAFTVVIWAIFLLLTPIAWLFGGRVSIITKQRWCDVELVFDTHDSAMETLGQLKSTIEQYGEASVLDLYDLVGINGAFSDCNRIWKNVDHARVIKRGTGYVLQLPKEEKR